MKYFPLLLVWIFIPAFAQYPASTAKESRQVFKTYPFSDPDPIPKTGIIYPYYRFDGYAAKPVDKSWKVVELENTFIRVMILPEIGGKIWAAIDKSTGKSFVYFNHVVKFRDIAMRGPWTSGGIEANYGIIGHTPNTATPVDYLVRQNDDGSASCFIGTLDLLTQTYWTMEINLPKDKAFFTTRSFWHNGTPLEQPYYTWMNVGMPAMGGLQFAYPGYQYLGHGGDHHAWSIHEENKKDLSFYDNNNFGSYKSYHVFGTYTDFFGAYYHKEKYGMARYAAHDEKPGKKIWIWGLSQQGMIWDKLLTDTDGQYVEIQSGRLFNQTAGESTLTPFKHRGFSPSSTDEWTEYWFPVGNTGGIVKANPYGALNVVHRNDWLSWAFSPVQDLTEEWTVKAGNQMLYKKTHHLRIQQLFKDSVQFSGDLKSIVLSWGGKKFEYHADPEYGKLDRPLESPADFDWESVQGLYLKGKEHVRAREYDQARTMLEACLKKDPNYLLALNEMAALCYRNFEDDKALRHARHALSIDTYDGAANYYYGLIQARQGHELDARDGFEISSASVEFRSAASLQLARSYFREQDYGAAEKYVRKSLTAHPENIEALQLLAIMQRVTHQTEAKNTLELMAKLNPLNHFIRAEKLLAEPNPQHSDEFLSMIRNEMPLETHLQLGITYASLGRLEDAMAVMQVAPHPNAELLYWLAWLQWKKGDTSYNGWLEKAHAQSPALVFPFRSESLPVVQWALDQTHHWKASYYLALLHAAHRHQEEAAKLLAACGDQPDFPPFYAFRASLIKESAMKDLEKASFADPREWRYGKLMIQYHLDHDDLLNALQISGRYYKTFPGDYRISVLHAKVLLLNQKYSECLSVLKNTQVLPFEGATESRQIYHEAQLMTAIDLLKARRLRDAKTAADAARLYPENLGAGQPYPADRDERLENYVSGVILEMEKKPGEAKKLWESIANSGSTGGSTALLTAMAWRKLGQEQKGSALLDDWVHREPHNVTAQWCAYAFRGTIGKEIPGEEYARVTSKLLSL